MRNFRGLLKKVTIAGIAVGGGGVIYAYVKARAGKVGILGHCSVNFISDIHDNLFITLLLLTCWDPKQKSC